MCSVKAEGFPDARICDSVYTSTIVKTLGKVRGPMATNELDVRRRWEYVEKGPTVWRIRISKLTTTPLPRALTNTADIAELEAEPDTARVIRKPDVGDGGLDWNVVTLAPSGEAGAAAGVDVDVLIHVLSGSGRLVTDKGTIPLAPGALFWLPRRSRPQFSAGPDGLRYLAVNQKWDILPP